MKDGKQNARGRDCLHSMVRCRFKPSILHTDGTVSYFRYGGLGAPWPNEKDAEGICDRLEKEGMWGLGIEFPLKTWVTKELFI